LAGGGFGYVPARQASDYRRTDSGCFGAEHARSAADTCGQQDLI
jgi:hypothetical protein